MCEAPYNGRSPRRESVNNGAAPRGRRLAGSRLPAPGRDAIKQTRLLQNNPVPLDETDCLTIYEQRLLIP